MAETIKYGMGQLRYVASSEEYMKDLFFEYRPIRTKIINAAGGTSGEDQDESNVTTEYYQDICLKKESSETFNFVPGTPYLLRLNIPKDSSYPCNYYIKLISNDAIQNEQISANFENFQMIKWVTIPYQIGSGDSTRVILFPVDSEGFPDGNGTDLRVAIVKELERVISDNLYIFADDVLYDNGYYFLYSPNSNQSSILGWEEIPARTSENGFIEILNKNVTLMDHIWKDEANKENDFVGFNIIFTPRTADISFGQILIQMVRNNYDKDIYSESLGVFGRRLNHAQWVSSPEMAPKVFELTNVLDGLDIDSFTNIGIYSHPNLLMAINGEEIRIGQSGYYELNDFEITSFAIAAENSKDNFTLDYQYRVE